MPLVACIQINGSSDIERNLCATEDLVRKAARAGARLVATPEATTYLGPHSKKAALAADASWHLNSTLGEGQSLRARSLHITPKKGFWFW